MKMRSMLLLGIGLVLGALYLTGGQSVLAQTVDNDAFTSPLTVPEIPFHQYVNLADQSMEGDEPVPSCLAESGTFGHSAWYDYTPAESRVVAIRIAAPYYTGVGVYQGSELTALTEVQCRQFESLDYGPQVQVLQLTGGETYRFQFGSLYDVWGELALFALIDVNPVAVINAPETMAPNWLYPFNAYESYDVGGQIITEYAWDFGDGTTASGIEVEKSYASEGEYVVRLTVTTEDGRSAFTEHTVSVQSIPLEVSFNYDPMPFTGVEIYFYAWVYDPMYIDVKEVLWDFGDGGTAEGYSVEHTYAADGDYTVTMTVTSWDGRTASDSQVLQLRTHDISIKKMNAPQSARVGQTRQISVDVKNIYSEEFVTVRILANDNQFGYLQQTLPPRKNGNTYTFSFNYTFTAADALAGKVVFRAEAWPEIGDSFPSDNVAVATPATKVSGDKGVQGASADGVDVEQEETVFLPLVSVQPK